MRFLLFSGLIFLSVSASAKWVGVGSGELFKDAHNPFFLKNVSQVKYCVDVAKPSVSLAPDAVRATVREALGYWKNELRKVSEGEGRGQFVLGNQAFSEVPCTDPSVQLSFLVGYETLTAPMIEFLVEPTRYIGITVRTDYDADLRGKGFIYISSDMGPHAYHGGTDPTLVEKAWSRPQLFKYVLLHELGHVFGLPHTGSGLMSETFLEQVLSTSLADAFERSPVESFFMPDEELDLCGFGAVTGPAREFFAIPASHNCLHLTRNSAVGSVWQVHSRENSAAMKPGTYLGRIIAASPEISDFHPRPAIILQLMGNTSLFTPEETKFRTFMFGPYFLDFGMKGNFVPASGVAKPVYVRQAPNKLIVQGTVNSRIENIVSHFSVIDLLLMRDPTPIYPWQAL